MAGALRAPAFPLQDRRPPHCATLRCPARPAAPDWQFSFFAPTHCVTVDANSATVTQLIPSRCTRDTSHSGHVPDSDTAFSGHFPIRRQEPIPEADQDDPGDNPRQRAAAQRAPPKPRYTSTAAAPALRYRSPPKIRGHWPMRRGKWFWLLSMGFWCSNGGMKV